jgi:hypothetical protein
MPARKVTAGPHIVPRAGPDRSTVSIGGTAPHCLTSPICCPKPHFLLRTLKMIVKIIMAVILSLTGSGTGAATAETPAYQISQNSSSVILAVTKGTCDREYQVLIIQCRCTCKSAWERSKCWREASAAYARCLAAANRGNGSGGGGFGGRMLTPTYLSPDTTSTTTSV